MKKILSLGLLLCVVCACAGMFLAFVYHGAQKRILDNENATLTAYRTKVLPRALRFEQMEQVANVFVGYDAQDEIVGRVVLGTTRGYSGPINFIVGVDTNSAITGVYVMQQTETPGMGTKICEPLFLQQFIGKQAKSVQMRKDDRRGSIDAITGATISARALTNGIRDALNQRCVGVNTHYKDGIFRGHARGYGGMVQATVKIVCGRIVAITAVAPYETKTLWQRVVTILIPKILEQQTTQNIDTVTGATISGKALCKAVNNALERRNA